MMSSKKGDFHFHNCLGLILIYNVIFNYNSKDTKDTKCICIDCLNFLQLSIGHFPICLYWDQYTHINVHVKIFSVNLHLNILAFFYLDTDDICSKFIKIIGNWPLTGVFFPQSLNCCHSNLYGLALQYWSLV